MTVGLSDLYPEQKVENQYLLTILCAATRFPKAIPLRNITAQSVAKALTRFFTTFGPSSVETDQGTNFKSVLFKQVLAILNVQHVVSSPHHPQSQGALERLATHSDASCTKVIFGGGLQVVFDHSHHPQPLPL